MGDRAWKQEEPQVARLLGGTRYPVNSGGRWTWSLPPS